MKRLLAALLLMPGIALAQTVPGTANISWTLPTQTVTGLPLTGQYAITSIQVFVSTSQIPDTSTMQPTVTLGAGATSTAQTLQVANGGTLYARVKVCNASGCGPFSAQGSKPVVVDTRPAPATSVTIELTIN